MKFKKKLQKQFSFDWYADVYVLFLVGSFHRNLILLRRWRDRANSINTEKIRTPLV